MSRRTSEAVRASVCIEGLESRTLLSATVVGTPTIVNATKLAGPQSNESMAISQTNPQELFVVSDNNQASIFFAHSTDGGATWTNKFMATGADGFPVAFGNPSIATDKYGNLFLAYETVDTHAVNVLMSYDSGNTFHLIQRIKSTNSDAVVATGNNAVYVAFRQLPLTGAPPQTKDGGAVVYSAQVFGLGRVKTFKPELITGVQSNVQGLAVGPAGQLTAAYVFSTAAGPQQIYVATDPDGLGPKGFGPANNQVTTQVGNDLSVLPQLTGGIDPSASIAYDLSADQFTGRLYLVYTDDVSPTAASTNIVLRYSDDNGATFSAPITVNDDVSSNGHFDPHVAVDPVTGAVAVTWYDARNDNGLQAAGGGTDASSNTDVQVYGAVGTPTPTGVEFSDNFIVQPAYSNPEDVSATNLGPPTIQNGLGRRTSSVFYNGNLYPTWADNSNSTADNGDGTLSQPDAYVAHVTVSVTGSATGTFIGSFGDTNGNLVYTTASGARVTFTLHGGQGFVVVDPSGNLSVHLSGTKSSSSLTINATGGRATLGTCLINGSIGTINAPTSDLVGTFSIQGTAKTITLGNINGGTLTATGALGTVNLTTLASGKVLSGASPGGDNAFSGPGDTDDSFGIGSIGTLRVKGAITASVVGAGANPVNGIFGDGDDQIVGGTSSFINAIFANSADSTTRFEAGLFKTVKLPSPVNPATDPRFVS
jgi:hypothetical protein